MGKRRQYTTEERDRILEVAGRVGVVEVARLHDVPQTTVSNWLNRDAMKIAAKKAATAKVAKETSTARVASRKRSVKVAKVKSTRKTPSARVESKSAPTEPAATPGPVLPKSSSSRKRVARHYTPSEKAQVLENAARTA